MSVTATASPRKIRFSKTKTETKGTQSPRSIGACSLKFINLATKDIIAGILTRKKWTDQSFSALTSLRSDQLKQLFVQTLRKKATVADLQKIEEKIILDHEKRKKSIQKKFDQTKQQRQLMLGLGQKQFKPNHIVYIFDQVKRTFRPIKAVVVDTQKNCKIVDVRILETTRWREAGNIKVYANQLIRFKFDHVTQKWLRDGMTSEVVRGVDIHGKEDYFILPYTRQYLLLFKK